jgi:uncharacterized protein
MARILAFTDMHGSRKALQSLKEKASKADLVLCLGDLTIFEQNLRSLLAELGKLEMPILVIPGNHESPRRLKEECEKQPGLIYMNNRIYETESFIILGAEGSGFALNDPKFEQAAKEFEKALKGKKKPLLLMTHAPPYGTELDMISDGHCGNKSIRNFIQRMKPAWALSGHIHESNYRTGLLGETRLLNPGPEGRVITI